MAKQKTNDGDKSLLAALKEITTSDDVAYYIVFKYAPELLEKDNIKTYEDLQAAYARFGSRDEKNMDKLMYKESSQKAIKYLLKRLDTSRDITLLNKYYKLAEGGDVKALEAYLKFKTAFFADKDETDELKELLRGASTTTNEDDFEMDF
ncbi:hypothetical protein IJ556_03250 [bacterium]|nr:hypothetical protein [bacterium]